MIKSDIDGVILTTQKIISVDGGNVLHAMKRDDPGYTSFGEAYFSTVKSQAIKAWKRHRRMTLNIVVPVGSIRFIIVDDRNIKASKPHYQEVIHLRYFKELSYNEISKEIKAPVNNVKIKILRAKKLLAEIILSKQ